MSDNDLAEIISSAKAEYAENPPGDARVAFLGKVSSGKTITTALLKYTLTKFWIPKTNGNWEAVVKSGHDRINTILNKLKNGEFTSGTTTNDYPQLIITVNSMQGRPVKFELTLHDMAGENYSDLLTDEYYDEDDRLKAVLKDNSKYLAFADRYVIMIDCGAKDTWDTDDDNVGPMISAIREIKQKMHNHDLTEKIHSPIAIVFTKTDLLSESDQKKSANDLAKDHPTLLSSLNLNHDGTSLRFFKTSVASIKETESEALERNKQKLAEEKQKYNKKLKQWQVQVDNNIEQAVEAAKTQAVAENKTKDEIENIIDDIEAKNRSSYQRQFDETHPYPKLSSDNELQWKSKVPLNYSRSEYMKLISWLLDTNDVD